MKWLLLLLLISCKSPLFDHEKEGTAAINNQIFFRSEGLYATTDWLGQLSLAGNSFQVQFFEDRDLSVLKDPVNEFFVCLWMGIHGHGSLPVRLERVGVGTYSISEVEFIMPGPWEIRLYFLDSPAKSDACDTEVEDLDPDSIIELKEVPVEV